MPLDLAGHRSGLLAILCLAPEGRHGKPSRNRLWICACDCGGPIRAVPASRLLTAHTRSCGCISRQPHDLTGRRFGKLLALEQAPNDPAVQGRQWVCRCDCGRLKTVRAKDLGSGNTTSCGCQINRLLVSRGEVTPRQRLILEALAAGRRSAAGLDRLLGVSPPSLSLTTSALAKRGYLSKRRIPPCQASAPPGEPGRQIELTLLPKGRAYLRGMAARAK